ncbi:SIR2 family protein [Desertivirga brevis]|uniref:SIR2 family protein n=1 Tax=Desertivirga brevis TaxID=2810310 RepID=UPI001A9766DB|nr:SIR2 family protein [Pedobacter sp. SYSU D00873]
MHEQILLKNKNLIIKIHLEEIEKDDLKIFKEKQLLIIRADGAPEIYEIDELGQIAIAEKEEKVNWRSFAKENIRNFYKNLLQSRYSEIEHLVILTGAGSSVGIGEGENVGLTMAGLWNALLKEDQGCLERLIRCTKYGNLEDGKEIDHQKIEKDLEALLSKAGMMNSVAPHKQLDEDIKTVKKFIVKKCTLCLSNTAPHQSFLNKTTLRPQKYPRVKLFTLNYDTLFEDAAGKERFTVIDGFTFSSPRIFNGKYFDYDIIETRHSRQDKHDSIIPKLFYLFKMHGSLTWEKKNGEITQSDSIEDVVNRVMIFPQDSKFEYSYEQPYFEMMARFQQALRTENTLLITIGYSYLDKHISSVIIESLKQNPSLNLITVTYPVVIGTDKSFQAELHSITELQSRVTMIAETFTDFTLNYPENNAHKRFDMLEELNQSLKKINLTTNVL